MQNKSVSRIFGLDCVRALAITLVILSHCSFLLFPDETSLFLDSVRLMGAIGVDLFFVLSGYLIGGILLKQLIDKKTSWSFFLNFWKRRWFRTLPNYFLILILNILLFLIIEHSLPKDIFLYYLFFQNFAWKHPNFFTEAWSLSVEEYAYLLLPIIFYIGMTINKKWKAPKFFLWVTISTIVALALIKLEYFFNNEVSSYKDWSTSFRKVVIYRLDSIYYGFLAAYCVKLYPEFISRNKKGFLVFGLCLFAVLHIFIYMFNLLPQNNMFFYTFFYLQLLCISLIALFPNFIELKSQTPFKSIVLFVSTRSYAMYLVNYSLILLSLQRVFDLEETSVLSKVGLLFFFLGICIIISNLIYVYFEKPILKYRDTKFPR